MIDNVAIGPVNKQPGDNEKIDERAWEAMIILGDDPRDYMLMHYEPSGRFGRLVAAFKNRNTRQYRRVSFQFTERDTATRKPAYEPERDVVAARAYLLECEAYGMQSNGLRQSVADLERRAATLADADTAGMEELHAASDILDKIVEGGAAC